MPFVIRQGILGRKISLTQICYLIQLLCEELEQSKYECSVTNDEALWNWKKRDRLCFYPLVLVQCGRIF